MVHIIGSSIIDRAHQHSENRPTGCNLGLDNYNCLVRWVGMTGMKWSNLVCLVHGSINILSFSIAVEMILGMYHVVLRLKMSFPMNDKCTPSFKNRPR
jgi:hypothetical protein